MAQERDSGGLRAFGWLTEARIETTKKVRKEAVVCCFFWFDDFLGAAAWLLVWFGCTIDSRNS